MEIHPKNNLNSETEHRKTSHPKSLDGLSDGEYSWRGDYHRQPDKNWRYYPVYIEKMAIVRRYLHGISLNEHILDIGCGEGLLVEEFHKKGYRIQGLDLHYHSILIRKGNITNIHFPDSSFDRILALDVIEHLNLTDQARAFSELFRIVRPGGQCLISLPNLAHFASRITFFLFGYLLRTSSVNRHPGDRPMVEYLRLIRQQGFCIYSRKGIFPTYPLLSTLTYLSPGLSLPIHKLFNRIFAPPSICFQNLLFLKKPR